MIPNISKTGIPEKPPTEYYTCQITGFGTRMLPPFIKTQNRMKKDITSGYLRGIVLTWSNRFKTRHMDVTDRPHPSDRVYDFNEYPELNDEIKVIQRLREEYSLLEERVIVVDYAYDKGAWRSRSSITPRGFQIPVTLSERTQPENEPPHIPSEEVAPLEVPLGDIARHNRKGKKEKRAEE